MVASSRFELLIQAPKTCVLPLHQEAFFDCKDNTSFLFMQIYLEFYYISSFTSLYKPKLLA